MAEQQRSPASAPARREPSHATQLLLQALETDRTLSPAERVASITSPSEGVDRAEYRAISPVERSQRARQQREERWKRTGADDGSRAVAEMAMTRVKALAVRINDELKLFEVEVVGTAPAVGIFVVTSDNDLPELQVQESELMFAAEVNIVLQRRGDHWVTDAQMEKARLEFEEMEHRVLTGEHVTPPGLIFCRW